MTDQDTLAAGLDHHRAGRTDQARAIYAALLADDPDNAEAHHLMGVLQLQTAAPAQAIEHLDRAVALAPDVAKYHGNRAAALGALGRRDEAVAAMERAVGLDPDDLLYRINLATALGEAGRQAEAGAVWHEVAARDPANADARSELAHLALRAGDMDAAVPLYRRASELAPDDPVRHSHLCVMLNSAAGVPLAEIYAEHRAWNDRHAKPLAGSAPPPDNDRDPDRPLRVGYVSADWRHHPVGYLTLPALSNHDPDRIEAYLYSSTAPADDLTEVFKGLGHAWRDVAREDDAALFETIRRDRIDVLVDLTGHHNRNRLLVFARRAAPVQISWESYSFSTGLDAMDYYIGDAVQTPENLAPFFAEKIARLPGSMACIGYPADAPDVGPSPAGAAGRVTFGVHASPTSVTPAVIDVWESVVAGCPDAVVLPLGWGAAAVADKLEARGLAVLRRESSGVRGMYAPWNDVDIALDPFPVSGNIETLEALWMGVPVVALAGERRIARRSAGHLTAVGLTDLVAHSAADYARIATALAADSVRLASLRKTLRATINASPLADGPGHTRALENIYRDAWRRWCAG